MANDPLVSVITRTLNRPEMLREALDSVAAQTYENIELVVINDGGHDVSDIARHYEEKIKTVRYIHLETNRGLSVAGNIGMESATGKYINFLDDDDWFHPEHISGLVETLEADEEVGVAYSAVQCIREDSSGNREPSYVFETPYDPTLLLVQNYIPVHAALFRRELVSDGCRFDESLDTYDDWDFWVQLSNKTQFKFVDKVTAYYRITQGSGFGLDGDEVRIRNSLEIFYNKWRQRWTNTQLVDITNYAKQFKEKISLQKRLNENILTIEQLHNDIAKLHDKITTNKRLLKQALSQSDYYAEKANAMERSHSWRFTAPLRWISRLLRGSKQRYKYHGQKFSRNTLLGLHVLRHEGVIRLISRIGKKTLTPRNTETISKLITYKPVSDWHPLQIATSSDPHISIIIPITDKALATFNCLNSIASCTDNIAFEIILVGNNAGAQMQAMLAAVTGIKYIENPDDDNFFHSCNIAAKLAKGKFLVFLRNEVMLANMCLQHMIETFDDHPDSGIVGARLITTDGTLNEAGGIVWSDGALTLYGKGSNPGRPEFNYLRNTDFCSENCLAIPRNLFDETGGFDHKSFFCTYAVVDLAFRLAGSGCKTSYQPAAVAVCDLSFPATQRIEHSQHAIANKWSSELATHGMKGEPPELEKDRGIVHRVLVMDAVKLTPDQDSGSLRMRNILECLIELGNKVTFVAALNLEHGGEYGELLQQRGIEVLYSPYVSSIEEYLSNNGQYFDVIIVSRAAVAERFLKLTRLLAPSALLIFDTVDLHFLRETRMATLSGSAAMMHAANSRKEQELDFARIADITLVVSPVEKDILLGEKQDLNVEVLSNIHDVYGSANEFEDRDGIMFIGGFNHPPNTDAVLYFIEDIIPLIKSSLGSVTTYIVGANPPPKIRKLASSEIIVTGFVPDISQYFNSCRLSVAPLRYGAGVKGKVNMSMAYGVPVVATPIATEGMQLTNGVDVIIGETAESFANGVVNLYNNADLWRHISRNGLINIEKHFSRNTAKHSLNNILARVYEPK